MSFASFPQQISSPFSVNCKLHVLANNRGPLLDRIDIHIEVPAVPFSELSSGTPGTSSEQIREQVIVARMKQSQRFAKSSTRYNAQMNSRQIRELCPLNKAGRQVMKDTVEEMGLSARAHDKILRVARTIADVSGDDDISIEHLHEAVNYRMLDRQIWT